MCDGHTDGPSSVPVPDGATPAERFARAGRGPRRTVWTDRMLTALEQGVRGGRWFTADMIRSTRRDATSRLAR